MTTGKYIRRAAGYFIKLLVLVGLLYLLLFLTGTARVSAELFFREMFSTPRGWMLFAALAVLSAFYPKFGYVSRTVEADVELDRDTIIKAFGEDNYVLAVEMPDGGMTFRASSVWRRLWMTFDDKVIVIPAGGGTVSIEGIRKEVVRAQFRINTYINNR